jgi:hypothetical protein
MFKTNSSGRLPNCKGTVAYVNKFSRTSPDGLIAVLYQVFRKLSVRETCAYFLDCITIEGSRRNTVYLALVF